ncbi:MAG: hypothetical protein IH998_13400 [Proteobacteria bacterium]|nr:hypothetical protein [Pseudomonadota bacterium]
MTLPESAHPGEQRWIDGDEGCDHHSREQLAAALTALVIGSALLLLSAFWQPVRRRVVGLLGGLEERLPPTQIVTA